MRVRGSVGGWCGAVRGRGEPLRRSGEVQEKAVKRMREISYFGVSGEGYEAAQYCPDLYVPVAACNLPTSA